MTLKLQSNDSNTAEIADSFHPGRTFIVNLQERTCTCLSTGPFDTLPTCLSFSFQT